MTLPFSRRFTRALPLAFALAVAACATATPYQPLQDGQGYVDQKLEETRYRITFAGNSMTPRHVVENYLLYRAAELTLANGHDYFVLADKSTDAETSYSHSISAHGGFGRYGWYPRSRGFGIGVGTGVASPSTEYEAQADILMFKGEKREGDLNAFDARQVKANLEPTILRPEVKAQG